MIGIIGAMKEEIDGIREKMSDCSTQTISGVEYTKGILNGVEVVTAMCGVGKVFAAICTQTMILTYKPDAIINTGIGGTLSEKISILDMAISSGVVQHDMDTTAVGDPIGLLSGINMVELPASEKLTALAMNTAKALGINCESGIIASGDQFIAGKDKKANIKTTFNAIACEMEGAAIGHVCYVNQVPFVVIRAISDDVSDKNTMDYWEFKPKACEISKKLTLALVAELGKAQ